MTPLAWWRRDIRTIPMPRPLDNLPASAALAVQKQHGVHLYEPDTCPDGLCPLHHRSHVHPLIPQVDCTEPTCPEQLPEADRRKPAPEWVRGSRVGMCNHLRWQPPMPAELREFIHADSRFERGEE